MLKLVTVKDTLPFVPLLILPLTSNTLIPLLLSFFEAILEVLFHVSYSCDGCLNVPNLFKAFNFHGYFDFGVEPEVSWCQI